jgi:hypothetical protein
MERKFNVIRWPNADGQWWLVSESENGYLPLLELHPKWTPKTRELMPTWENQLWRAAELLVHEGIEAVRNPHAMIGEDCKCGTCFCCAAMEIVRRAAEVPAVAAPLAE